MPERIFQRIIRRRYGDFVCRLRPQSAYCSLTMPSSAAYSGKTKIVEAYLLCGMDPNENMTGHGQNAITLVNAAWSDTA